MRSMSPIRSETQKCVSVQCSCNNLFAPMFEKKCYNMKLYSFRAVEGRQPLFSKGGNPSFRTTVLTAVRAVLSLSRAIRCILVVLDHLHVVFGTSEDN